MRGGRVALLLAAFAGLVGCERHEPPAHPAGNTFTVWFHGSDANDWPLVAVELRDSTGTRVLRATPDQAARDIRFVGAPVPAQGPLHARVNLVTPDGDTLARSEWLAFTLAPDHDYQVTVAVREQRPRHPSTGSEMTCAGPWTAYPLRRRGRPMADSLFVVADPAGIPRDVVVC